MVVRASWRLLPACLIAALILAAVWSGDPAPGQAPGPAAPSSRETADPADAAKPGGKYVWEGTIHVRATGGRRFVERSWHSEWRYNWRAKFDVRLHEREQYEKDVLDSLAKLPPEQGWPRKVFTLVPDGLHYVIHANTSYEYAGSGGRQWLHVLGTDEGNLSGDSLDRRPDDREFGRLHRRLHGQVNRNDGMTRHAAVGTWPTWQARSDSYKTKMKEPGLYHMHIVLWSLEKGRAWSSDEDGQLFHNVHVTFSDPKIFGRENRPNLAHVDCLITQMDIHGYLSSPDQKEVVGSHFFKTESNDVHWAVTWHLTRRPLGSDGRG